MQTTYSNKSNAIRGFKQLFPAIAAAHSNDGIRMDFINPNPDGSVSISLEAVADYQSDRLGVVSGTTLLGVPCLRRSARVGSVAAAKALFAKLPAGTDWCKNGWRAYKGGCDIDAAEVSSGTYQGCLDEIDEVEDD